jgi:hypothetical protein
MAPSAPRTLASAHGLVGQADDDVPTAPGRICTCTSTSSTSMPWKATVFTRATVRPLPSLQPGRV